MKLVPVGLGGWQRGSSHVAPELLRMVLPDPKSGKSKGFGAQASEAVKESGG